MQQPQYTSSPPTNTMAIVSLVSGIASWFLLPLIGAIVAIVAGHMAHNEIKNSYGMQGGDGLAVAGLVLGYLNVLAACVTIAIIGAPLLGCSICGLCGAFTEGLGVSNAAIPPIPLN